MLTKIALCVCFVITLSGCATMQADEKASTSKMSSMTDAKVGNLLPVGALRDDLERAEHDLLGDRLLAVEHDAVDETRHLPIDIGGVVRVTDVEHRAGLASDLLARHGGYLGRLVPYLERRWRRPCTPVVSRVPRTTW